MELAYEAQYHEVEQNHFWFKGRRDMIRLLLRDADRTSSILDIGCSSGITLQHLSDMGFDRQNLMGIDISERAISNAHDNGFPQTKVMDAQDITLQQKFDIIISSDCLEHLPKEAKALNNWYTLLKPSGKLIVFVPACMSLWSYHDEVNHHVKRYTKLELVHALKDVGFSIEKSSYWNTSLFLPVWLVRKWQNKKLQNSNKGDLQGIPKFNNLLYRLLQTENRLLQYMSFPIGISTYCIARKAR